MSLVSTINFPFSQAFYCTEGVRCVLQQCWNYILVYNRECVHVVNIVVSIPAQIYYIAVFQTQQPIRVGPLRFLTPHWSELCIKSMTVQLGVFSRQSIKATEKGFAGSKK